LCSKNQGKCSSGREEKELSPGHMGPPKNIYLYALKEEMATTPELKKGHVTSRGDHLKQNGQREGRADRLRGRAEFHLIKGFREGG